VSLVFSKAETKSLAEISAKIHEGKRLTRQEALELYDSDDLETIAKLGDFVRKAKAGVGKEHYVYYVHNMHLNPTNFCMETCKFCSYANPQEREKAYTWTVDQVVAEATRGAELGINEIHMVGGLNPACDLNYYEDVFRTIKRQLPQIHLKALTAVEIDYLAKLAGISIQETLKRLVEAGLGSMPGGGAEMFDEEVRAKMAVSKTPAELWLEIHGSAHALGLKTNATMLTGIGETRANKVDHMLLLREQQDLSHGFACFIPLKCYYEGTSLAAEVQEPSARELLKDIAISRIVLDNFPHIQAYWIQLGEQLAQLALSCGADDMNGTIGEEKITHAAGTKTPLQLAKEKMESLIHEAGQIPVERDTLYGIRKVSDIERLIMPPLAERLAAL
jgi:aminodeoxyfutalosine synthase